MFHTTSRRILVALAAISLGTATQAALTHRYSFTDGSLKDSAGNVAATLKGSAKIVDGKLILDNGAKGSDDPTLSYLEFTSAILPKTGSASLAVWFTVKETNPFARILNFGDKEGAEGRAFIYFTPRNSNDQARSAITATDAGSKTFIDSDPLDDGKPHCVVMVIDGTAKKLHTFVDGKEPMAAEDLGENTLDKVRQVNNWLGRSSYDQDGGLSGSIDEFRVYDHALSAAEVAAMVKAGPDTLPAPTTAPAK